MKQKTKLFMLILALLGVLFGSAGCSTTAKLTEGMTPEQKTAFLEQREYERIAKREQERDDIRALIELCKASKDRVLIYSGRTGAGRLRKNHIPRHARLHDYQCARTADVRDWLRGMGH